MECEGGWAKISRIIFILKLRVVQMKKGKLLACPFRSLDFSVRGLSQVIVSLILPVTKNHSSRHCQQVTNIRRERFHELGTTQF